MAQSARARLNLEVSANTDYSRPHVHEEWSDTSTPDEALYHKAWETDSTNASTFYIDHLGTSADVFVYNTDSTNFVTLTFRTGANSTTDNKIKLLAGEWIRLVDVTASNNLSFTADTAAVVLEILVLGT